MDRQPNPPLEPGKEPDFTARGNVFYQQQEYAQACAAYDEAIRLDPHNASAYFNRASARSQLMDWQGAAADFSSSLRLNPEDAEAFALRARMREQNGDAAGASADYAEALRINPQQIDALLVRALDRFVAGDRRGAVADVQTILKIDPNHAEATLSLGVFLAGAPSPAPIASSPGIHAIVQRLTEAGHTELCMQVAQAQMLGEGEGDPARCQDAAGRYQAIVDRCEHWLQHQTSLNAEYRAVLALAAANLGRYLAMQQRWDPAVARERQAIDLLEQLILDGCTDVRPTLAFAQMELGFALAKLGRDDEAFALIDDAKACCEALVAEGRLECRAELALACLNVGMGLTRLAQTSALGGDLRPALEAAEELSRAIALYGQLVAEGQMHKRHPLAKARRFLGTVLYFQSRYEEAIPELRQSVALYEQLVSEGRDDLALERANSQTSLDLVLQDYRARGSDSSLADRLRAGQGVS
jgi:tetratricopeptide (TPR) repeat protein